MPESPGKGRGTALDFAYPKSEPPVFGWCSRHSVPCASGALAGGFALSDEAPRWSQWWVNISTLNQLRLLDDWEECCEASRELLRHATIECR